MALRNRREYNRLRLRRKKRAVVRRFWVHDILKEQNKEGAFHNLFEKLQKDPEKFFNYFRMSEETFNYILSKIKDKIQKQNTHFRMCIQPKEMLAVTLKYLATGCTFGEFFYTYRIGVTTAAKIVYRTCCAIWDALSEAHFPEATPENWMNIAANFGKHANFPFCLGAVDGKHVRIQNFPHEGSMNFNYKKYHSIVLMAVADADYKFTCVNVGAYGKDCDANILRQTEFWDSLVKKKLNIPDPASLPPENIKVPYVFVADDAFPMQEHIMRGYGGHNLNTKQKVFNYRLCRARRYVECAFGILTNKWRIFHRPLILSRPNAVIITKAAVLLHNVVRERDGYRPEDLMPCTLQPFSRNDTASSNKSGRGIRTCFVQIIL